MAREFVNGAFVSQVWTDDTSEVVAAFQYFGAAQVFAGMQALDQTKPRGITYIAVNAYDGEVSIYRQPTP